MAHYQAARRPLLSRLFHVILFIHGFASCGLGLKSAALRDYFGADQVLLPNLSHHPEVAIAQLEAQIASRPVDLLVGSSLGGYYATWLNREACLPAVLINPVVASQPIFDEFVGRHEHCDGSTFELTAGHIATLRGYRRDQLRDDERYLVLLQSGDEVLDYRLAATYYAAKEVIVEPGGDHRFAHFENHLPRIAAWREKYAQETKTAT